MATTQPEPFDWYEAPLYYDIIFDSDTPRECDFLVALMRRHVRDLFPLALEPACGTGRLLSELAKRGVRASGFDASDGMIAFARRRLREAGVRAPVRKAMMQDFRYRKPFDFAFCLVSTFKHLLTEEDAAAHLRCVAAALKPGGVYALGFHLTDYRRTRPETEQWSAERDGVRVVCTIEGGAPDARTRLEPVRSLMVVRGRGGETRRFESRWSFRTYNAHEFRTLLKRAPELEHVETYGFNMRIDRPIAFAKDRLDHIVVLRRREG
jgi:SAM-dependent methyltransferase